MEPLPPATIAALGLTTSALAATAATLTYAALSASSQLFGPILIDSPNPTQIALTFDDGPNPAATPELLDILAAAEVRATFFLVGSFVRAEPDLTRRIAAGGHAIGNHTMTHPWLAWQSASRIRTEIGDCSKLIEDTLGAPIRLFRPPHGARRPAVLSTARALGLTPTHWNVIVQDWKTPNAATLLLRLQRGIGRNRRRGRSSNILLHDGDGIAQGANRQATLEATRQLLALSRPSSDTFVTPEAWL